MVLPRSSLATKGIVPFNLVKHDLIKSFSPPDWIKDFPDENILNATVTSSADFFSLRWKIISRPLVWLHIIDLGNDRQSDGIHGGTPRENGFPWSCSDIFCIHNISPTKSIANQSLLITAILSRHATRSSGAWQDKRLHGRPIPYGLSRLLCRHERCLPAKLAREPLRDKTNTKSWYRYYSLLLTMWYTTKVVHKGNNQKQYFGTLLFTVSICRMRSCKMLF